MLHRVHSSLILGPRLGFLDEVLVELKWFSSVLGSEFVVLLQLILIPRLKRPFARRLIRSGACVVVAGSRIVVGISSWSRLISQTTREYDENESKDGKRTTGDTILHFLMCCRTLVVCATIAMPVTDIAFSHPELAVLHTNGLTTSFPTKLLMVAVLIGEITAISPNSCHLAFDVPAESSPLNVW